MVCSHKDILYYFFIAKFKFNDHKKAWEDKHERCDDVDDLIFKGSKVAWIEPGNLQNKARQYIKENKDYMDRGHLMVFECSPADYNLMRWDERNQSYKMHTPQYGWTFAPVEVMKTIPYHTKKKCKKHREATKIMISGYRKTHTIPTTEAGKPIPESMRQNSFETNNNCVILAAIIGIHFHNHEEEAGKLLQRLQSDPQKYDDLQFFKKGSSKFLVTSLQETIQHENIRYNLQRTHKSAGTDNKSRLEFVMNNKFGLYVALLEDHKDGKTHAVGLNLEQREIYDCIEDRVLTLSKKNLSYCCGPNLTIKGIAILAELKHHPIKAIGKKKKRKRENNDDVAAYDDRKPKAK